MAIRFDQIELANTGHQLYPVLQGSNATRLRVQSSNGYVDIGSGTSSSYGYLLTDRANFYVDKPVSFDGNISGYGGDETASFALYYDRNNTGYYLNPSGTSILSTLTMYTAGATETTQINMPRAGFITFYGDNSQSHSISSRNSAGSTADDLRINTYGALYINLDSNNNNSGGADFMIGRHGGQQATISDWAFKIDGETKNVGIGTTTNSDGDLSINAPKLHVQGPTTSGVFNLVARFQGGSDDDNTGAAILINHHNDRGLLLSAGRKDGDREVAYFDLVSSGGNTTRMFEIGKYGSTYFNKFAKSIEIPVAWDSGTLENNAIYAKNSSDGFGFGNGTGISTWWSWSTENGLMRMIDSANSGEYITLRTANTDRVSITSTGLDVKNSGAVKIAGVDAINSSRNFYANHSIYFTYNPGSGGNTYLQTGTDSLAIKSTSGYSPATLFVDDGRVVHNFSTQSPIYYDKDDTAYYADLAGTGTSISLAGRITGNSQQKRVKYSVWTGDTYGIGMKNMIDYGHIGTNEYAMTFQMNDDSSRGFWWGDSGHTDDQGAMSLTTNGKLVVATSLSVGEGQSVTSPNAATLYVDGASTFEGAITIDSDGATDNYYINMNEAGSTRFTIYENGNNVYFNGWSGHTIFRPRMLGSGSFAVTQGNNQMSTSGAASFAASVSSPIFYDSADTNYYVDPASTSNMVQGYYKGKTDGWSLQLGDASLTRVHDDDARASLVINAAYYPHLYINANTANTNENHGAVISMTGNISGGGFRRWSMGIPNLNPDMLTIGTYDNSANPHYGCGGDVLGEATWGSKLWLDSSSNLQTNGSMRSPIFYDSDNTGYYVNPAGTSRLGFGIFDGYDGASGNNARLSTGISLGRFSSEYAYMEIASSNNSGGWIDFNQADGTDYLGRIRYYNNAAYMSLYAATTEQVRVYSYASISLTSSRAPIFYDSNDTNYYTNPNGTSVMSALTLGSTFTQNGGDFIAHGTQTGDLNTFWQVAGTGKNRGIATGRFQSGASNSFTSANNANWIMNIYSHAGSGGAYPYGIQLAGTDTGDRNLMIRGVSNGGFSSWARIFHENSSDIKAPIFYDSNDTNYYCDPNGQSRLSTLNLGSSPTSGISSGYIAQIRGNMHMTNGSIDYVNQLHFNDNIRFVDMGNNQYLKFKYGGTGGGGIRFYDGGDQHHGYIYANGSGEFGLLDSDGHWSVRIPNGGSGLQLRSNNNAEFTVNDDHTLSHGSSRAPIFYDSDNTAYYIDPTASTSINVSGNAYLGRHVDAVNVWDGTGNSRKAIFVGWYSDKVILGNNDDGGHDTALNFNDDAVISVNPFYSYMDVTSRTALRAPIFYDSDDTGRYANPGGTSSFGTIHMNNNNLTNVNHITINDPGGGEGIEWLNGNGWKIYESPNDLSNASGNLQFVTTSTRRFTIDTSGNSYSIASSRAPIFYDSNDTTYFTDPASRSLLNNLDANHFGINNSSSTTRDGISLYGGYSAGEPTYGLLFTGTSGFGTYGSVTSDWATYFTMNNNDARGWIFRKVGVGNTSSISAGGVATFGSSTRSPIFYDNVDTNYYVDPANTGTAVYVKGDVVAYGASDERLKDNIKPIDNALDKVCSLSGNTFEWNEISHRPTGKKDVGVIAQEVEKVFPEIVDTRDSGYKAVDYQKLSAVLIEAVKELKTEIEELKDKCNGCTC